MEIICILNTGIPSHHAHVLQTLRMCDAFAKNGHELSIYYPDRWISHDILDGETIEEFYDLNSELQFESFPYFDINKIYSRLGLSPRSQILPSRIIFSIMSVYKAHKYKADIHYTRNALIAYLLTQTGLPTIFEIHQTKFGSPVRHLIQRASRSSALKTVVTLTPQSEESLIRLGVPQSKIHVSPDGVDLDNYNDAEDRLSARRKVGWPTSETIIGYTGSLGKGKGIYELIEACEELDEVSLGIVGGTFEKIAQLEEFTENRGIEDVWIEGHVPPNKVPLYQWAADVLVLPARSDLQTSSHYPRSTSPLKLFEYMAAKRPIIATRLPGIEQILTSGENCLLVEPDDSKALSEAIKHLVAHPRYADQLAAKAAMDVQEYTWDNRAKKIIESI